MSASRMPTLSPLALSARARLTAVVDLPTPPLPLATAMIAPTPGTPGLPRPDGGTGCGAAGPPAAGRAPPGGRDGAPAGGRGGTGERALAAPPFFSAVSTTMAP